MKFYVLAALFLALTNITQAGVPKNFDYTARAEIIEPAKQQFHWISRYQLDKWAQSITEKNGTFHFPSQIRKESQFASTFSVFARRKGLFTWIDPVLSKQAPENYGSAHAALIFFKIKPTARTIRVVSPYDDGREDFSELIQKAGIDYRTVDLVEHINPRLHEWILFSPKIVESMTADPAITHPLLKEFMKPYLENSLYLPHHKSVHYSFGGVWRPAWYNQITNKHPLQFNEQKYQSEMGALNRILEATPQGPYFNLKALESSIRYELSKDALRKPIPDVFTKDQLSCQTAVSKK